MTEKAESPARNISSFLFVIILIILVVSVGALYLAVEAAIRGNEVSAGSYMLIGFIGLSLLAYMLLQAKRKPLRVPFEIPQVITTILCQKCGFKNVRNFQRGDYIFKETEPCPKCNEKMMITSIYREVKEKEK